jgi:endonuclease/exonuclease/phosphatase family metal-dependent hydrolase
MGSALLFPERTRVLDRGVIEGLPKPQRGVWATVDMPQVGDLTAVSWHSPNKAGDSLAVKMDAFRAMSAWLEGAGRPLVLGADLNTWMDPIELAKPDEDDPHFEEHAFVGRDPGHGLEDGYRQALERNGRLQALGATTPQGPLAVSHILSSGAEHRMDRIFISQDLTAIDGGYLLDAARQAGSDHALHWLDLEGPARC